MNNAERMLKGCVDGALAKEAGVASEYVNLMNLPFVNLVTHPIGGVAALLTDTKDTPQVADMDGSWKDVVKNNLIPGHAPYRVYKRLGYSTRGSSLKDAKERLRARIAQLQEEGLSLKQALDQVSAEVDARKIEDMKRLEALQSKEAGLATELVGTTLNPLNLLATPVAAVVALLTDTRSTEEQALNDIKSTTPWKDVLVPGHAPYNYFKRIGHGYRNPDLKLVKARREKSEQQQG